MKRIALLTGLITVIAGGAAAFAATEPAPTAQPPAPDPYLGTWAMTIDGAYAGPVATVDGCNLAGEVTSEASGPDAGVNKRVARLEPAPCSIEVGVGMSAGFHAWLRGSLAATGSPHAIQLVRVDGKPYALELTGATLSGLHLPKLVRAAGAPAFLKLTLIADEVRRLAAPALPKEAMVPSRGIAPATIGLQLAGEPIEASSVGPWSVEIPPPAAPAGARDYVKRAQPPVLGDLPLRVPETRAVELLDPWMQTFLNTDKSGADAERGLTLTVSDGQKGRLEFAFDRTGIAKGDLAARADGARSYELYAERVTITAR